MNIKSILTIAVIVIIGAGILFARAQNEAPVEPVTEATSPADIVVYKTEFCGCCLDWVEHLKVNGMTVEVKNVESTMSVRDRLGVPHKLGSCHTAEINGYWVEGHVPADLIQKLVSEKPADIRGISAPGMPLGSPGMEGPNPVTFDIVAYHADGTTSVYATREGKESAD